jgi:L-threonylcarbamoyladenylate synthase
VENVEVNESTIGGLREESVLYRLGSISIEEIEAVIGPKNTNTQREAPIAPGMLSKHLYPKLNYFIRNYYSRSNFI